MKKKTSQTLPGRVCQIALLYFWIDEVLMCRFIPGRAFYKGPVLSINLHPSPEDMEMYMVDLDRTEPRTREFVKELGILVGLDDVCTVREDHFDLRLQGDLEEHAMRLVIVRILVTFARTYEFRRLQIVGTSRIRRYRPFMAEP